MTSNGISILSMRSDANFSSENNSESSSIMMSQIQDKRNDNYDESTGNRFNTDPNGFALACANWYCTAEQSQSNHLPVELQL